MKDNMQDMVCSECGTDENHGLEWDVTSGGDDKWYCCQCDKTFAEVETRAEYMDAVTADEEDSDA